MDNIKRHFQQMHNKFDKKFPFNGQKTISEISCLKTELNIKQNFKYI